MFFYGAAIRCPLWVTERWMVLSPRQVSGCQLWMVSQAIPCQGIAGLPHDGLWTSKLLCWCVCVCVCVFVSCCPGWYRLFLLSSPPLDSELIVIFGLIDQLADLFFSLTAGYIVLFMVPSVSDCVTVSFQSSFKNFVCDDFEIYSV